MSKLKNSLQDMEAHKAKELDEFYSLVAAWKASKDKVIVPKTKANVPGESFDEMITLIKKSKGT